MRRLKGFCDPREVISYAISVYHRSALNVPDVEDLLTESRLMVSRFRDLILQRGSRLGLFGDKRRLPFPIGAKSSRHRHVR